MEKYTGNYIGIVVQNNDPEMRGRIKVFIPHISSFLYENWNADQANKIFNSLDNPDIQDILETIKKVLPWAEYAGPVFGGCASGRYNATLKKATVSDTNTVDVVNNQASQSEGYRPVNLYNNELRYPDAFSATGKVGNVMVNPYAYQYVPSNYSNLARGMFSIPNVGSHVWVWFINGDTNYPVYFASAYGAEDIKRIYTMSQKTNLEDDDASSQDYPATYENIQRDDINSDVKTFRSKHVINSNKHAVEMIDTDGREILKFNHYSGSMLEFNNDSTIRMSTGNDQLMVNGESFNTFWKNHSTYVGGINDLIVESDSFEKVGKQSAQIAKEIYNINKQIHEKYKMLFDIKRTSSTAIKNEKPFETNVVSVLQDQDGTFARCPICNGLPYAQRVWNMSPEHLRLIMKIPIPMNAGGFPGTDMFVPGLQPGLPTNGSLGVIAGKECPLCNLNPSVYTYQSNHVLGFSPSTFNGFWNMETLKNTDLPDLLVASNIKLLDLQNELGKGGDKIESIAKNYVLNIGLVMNDLKSYRVDSRGKLKTVRLFVAPEDTILSSLPSPHVEHVDVDPTPGGDCIITAGNKMKLLVGANGINIKTFGPIEMYGSIVNLTGEQLNLVTKHELFIDGGEKLSLRGRNISLNPFEHNPVLVEGGLHVSRNFIVKGGAYIDGELGVQHITAPREWRQTQDSGAVTFLAETLPSGSPLHTHFIVISIPDHKHYYESIPLTLTKCKEETRDIMSGLGINSSTIAAAKNTIQINKKAAYNASVQKLADYADVTGLKNGLDAAVSIADSQAIFGQLITNSQDFSNQIQAQYDTQKTTMQNALNDIQNSYSDALDLDVNNFI